jgi:DNA-directed RNA polymerase subunit A"
MAGSYGRVRVGASRITYGITPRRALPHYPMTMNGEQLPLLHPRHTGFVKSGYSKGMQPDEYWFTSTAGIRSTIESGQGNIAKSGYLERKMIKALESCVVNKRRQVVNVRTGRVISPLVGDDGLAPYHIRGQSDVNTDGYSITLQPLLFEFTCKHDNYLAEAVDFPLGNCIECTKSSDLKTYESAFSKDSNVSEVTKAALRKVLMTREVTKPTVKRMVKRLEEFYDDSLCRFGEAIGATAGACIGEPATQTALRTFHFAGKLSSQGDIDRLKEILESPTNAPKHSPETRIYLLEGDTEEKAKRIQSLLTEVTGSQIIKLIRYDLNSSSIIVNFDKEALETYNLSPNIVYDQIDTVLSRSNLVTHEIVNKDKSLEQPLLIRFTSNNPKVLAYAKSIIMSSAYNGVKGVVDIEYIPPEKDEYQRHSLRILSSSNELLNKVTKKLDVHIDLDLIETNNHQWVYNNYGLEAALQNIYKELDVQMNENGIGEYDMRYIRTIVDMMGESGELNGLGPSNLSVANNPSILAAASLERVKQVLPMGAIMSNYDRLNGITESIVVGSTPKVGDYAPE